MKKTLILFACIAMIACNSHKKQEEDNLADIKANTLIKVGQQVPEFSLISLENDTLSTTDFQGKVVFINFFALSCPICIKELPHLESEIWQKYQSDQFVVIAIGREHNKEEMIKFQEKTGYTFPIYPDPGRKVYSKFANKYIPRNIILDKNGEIIYEFTGYNEEEFKKAIAIVEQNIE